MYRDVVELGAFTADHWSVTDSTPLWCQAYNGRWGAGLPIEVRSVGVLRCGRRLPGIERLEVKCEMADGSRVWWPTASLFLWRLNPQTGLPGRVSVTKFYEHLERRHRRMVSPHLLG